MLIHICTHCHTSDFVYKIWEHVFCLTILIILHREFHVTFTYDI
jgi:hypothetical protein